jgi:hypothetical protein
VLGHFQMQHAAGVGVGRRDGFVDLDTQARFG